MRGRDDSRVDTLERAGVSLAVLFAVAALTLLVASLVDRCVSQGHSWNVLGAQEP